MNYIKLSVFWSFVAILGICRSDNAFGREAVASPVFIGQHLQYARSIDSLQNNLFDGLRIWAAEGTTWRELEPQKDKFDFSRLDAHVNGAIARKLNVMYTFGQTPRWASARPDEKGNLGYGAAAEPEKIDDWAQYVRVIATRYRGRISAYEIMNEPRIPEALKMWTPGFYSGSAEKLAEMTKVAATEVRKVDPSAKIVCPSMAGFDGLKRLDYFLRTGAGKYCDVIGFHYYLPTHSIDELQKMITETQKIAQRHGLSKLPIWNTETGVLIAEAGFSLSPRHKSGAFSVMFASDEAANLAAKILITSHVLGIERTYWFAHDTSWMGSTIADKRKNQLNGFGESIAILKRWLSGKYLQRCSMSKVDAYCEVVQNGKIIGAVSWGKKIVSSEWLAKGFIQAEYLDGRKISLASSDNSILSGGVSDVIYLVASSVQ